MNLTLHIIRKDLVRFRWALLIWGLIFVYQFMQPNLELTNSTELRDYFQCCALFGFGALSIGLISGIVLEDHPTDSSGQWRTRPISPVRLMTAKLLLIGLLFIGLPLLAVWLRNLLVHTIFLYFQEYCMMTLVLTGITLSYAAVVACTKNVAHSLLLWVGIIFATGTLAEALGRFAPTLPRQVVMQMNPPRTLTILGFSIVTALAIILNQYLRRRLSVSIALMIAGSVGSALIGSMWGYYYFYRS